MASSLIDNLFIIASLFLGLGNDILSGLSEMLLLAWGAFNFAGDAAIGTGIAIVGILQNTFDFIPTPLFTFGF